MKIWFTCDLIFLGDLINPVPDLSDPGVNSGVERFATPDAPGHNTNLGPVVAGTDLHGSAGITLNMLELIY